MSTPSTPKAPVGAPCQWTDSSGTVCHGRIAAFHEAGTRSSYTVETVHGAPVTVPHWAVHVDGSFKIGPNPFDVERIASELAQGGTL